MKTEVDHPQAVMQHCTCGGSYYRNTLAEWFYCPHKRLGLVRPVGRPRWHVVRNMSPAEFADRVLTLILMHWADVSQFWEQELGAGMG
jgi:hypothetical protein